MGEVNTNTLQKIIIIIIICVYIYRMEYIIKVFFMLQKSKNWQKQKIRRIAIKGHERERERDCECKITMSRRRRRIKTSFLSSVILFLLAMPLKAEEFSSCIKLQTIQYTFNGLNALKSKIPKNYQRCLTTSCSFAVLNIFLLPLRISERKDETRLQA
jgi:hypothetical protein